MIISVVEAVKKCRVHDVRKHLVKAYKKGRGRGIMYTRVPDHPDITWAERTGHPSWNQPKFTFCNHCGEELCEDEAFQDEQYDYLCEWCLLDLHRRK